MSQNPSNVSSDDNGAHEGCLIYEFDDPYWYQPSGQVTGDPTHRSSGGAPHQGFQQAHRYQPTGQQQLGTDGYGGLRDPTHWSLPSGSGPQISYQVQADARSQSSLPPFEPGQPYNPRGYADYQSSYTHNPHDYEQLPPPAPGAAASPSAYTDPNLINPQQRPDSAYTGGIPETEFFQDPPQWQSEQLRGGPPASQNYNASRGRQIQCGFINATVESMSGIGRTGVSPTRSTKRSRLPKVDGQACNHCRQRRMRPSCNMDEKTDPPCHPCSGTVYEHTCTYMSADARGKHLKRLSRESSQRYRDKCREEAGEEGPR